MESSVFREFRESLGQQREFTYVLVTVKRHSPYRVRRET
jgi:hypothetical protein